MRTSSCPSVDEDKALRSPHLANDIRTVADNVKPCRRDAGFRLRKRRVCLKAREAARRGVVEDVAAEEVRAE